MKTTTLKKKKGFTMIETLVAITILLLSISAPLTIASQGLSSAFVARDQIVAFYLAQDAVEYIRNLRDENVLSSQGWLTSIPDTTGELFTVDTTDGDLTLCPSGVCPLLEYSDSSGFYGYENSGAVDSKFTRSVAVTSLGVDEALISVTVSWSTGALGKSFSVSESIFNWQ